MKWIYECEDCDFKTSSRRKFRMHQRKHEKVCN